MRDLPLEASHEARRDTPSKIDSGMLTLLSNRRRSRTVRRALDATGIEMWLIRSRCHVLFVEEAGVLFT
jgi:hypothetical protein